MPKRYLFGLSPVAGEDLCARFDGGRLSSDGGVLLLREIENGSELAGIPDYRTEMPLMVPGRSLYRSFPAQK
jgi:hypothetical protein